jgi:limonene 1,2-monooxygenase
MQFGAFIPPLHAPDQNPTLALKRDLELVRHLDWLGLDQAWLGEHHSLGWETIAEPEIMIAAAAMQTRRIKLGTGVVSLPYHHPLLVADRMAFLDHLTEGRLMMGVGPGSIPGDSHMMRLDYGRAREKMVESLDAIIALLTSDEPVNRDSDWFGIQDGHLNLRPFQAPCFDISVASAVSPSGARLAGEYGLGVLSLGASSNAGFESLRGTWRIVEERADRFGKSVDRSKWGIVTYLHLAETEEQAYKDMRFGFTQWLDMYGKISPYEIVDPALTDLDEILDSFNKAGIACVGTPDRAVEMIDRFIAQTGGFGALLVFGHDWANREATMYSYELLARHVAPKFQGSIDRSAAAADRALAGREAAKVTIQNAWAKATQAHEAEEVPLGP